MPVEERRNNSMDEAEPNDNFPAGMRVLVVDDDQTCLLVLERMLRQCEYHVTTTTQAKLALSMLRENRKKFDLIISDVQMPDMDGFKLLELVGLEMDLPVIMMSGNGDTKNVMKGITHGACDYLIKPVRTEELRNIWQHVIRKKKSKGPSNSDNSENPHQGTSEGGQASSAAGNPDRNKVNRKRKDQEEDEDDDDDYEESGQENDDPSAQKKPRVVWSVDLHRKFVAAVNQLGIDKAVPKKILDLMNVERLTRENVASHLQKYRLYLKRISSVASQHANMAAALGGKDPSYLRMASLDGMGDFHMMNGSGHLQNAAFPSFTSGGMLGRLNSPSAMGIRGLASSGMIQLGHPPTNAYSDISKLQSTLLPGNQNGSLLKGIPTSLELSHLQQNKFISRPGEFNPIGNPSGFPLSSGFPESGVTMGSSTNSFNASNNRLPLRGSLHQAQTQGSLGNQPSGGMPPNSSEPFGIRTVSAPLPDRCTDNWQGGATLPVFSSNPLPLGDLFDHADLTPGNMGDNNIAPVAPNLRNNSLDSSASSIPSLHDSRRDAQMQGSSVGIGGQLDNMKPSNYGNISNRIAPSANYSMQQTREDNRRDYMQNSNLLFNSVNTSLPMHGSLAGSYGQHFGQENAVHNPTLLSQSSSSNPFGMQQNGFENSSLETSMRLKGDFNMDQARSQNGFMTSSSGSLEDLMNAMIKREDAHDLMTMDGDIGGNIYPVRTCI